MTNHNNYNKLSNEERKHVDMMFEEIYKYAQKNRVIVKPDDRAEKLVEAIATFLVESKE